jgi:hypothetical protein
MHKLLNQCAAAWVLAGLTTIESASAQETPPAPSTSSSKLLEQLRIDNLGYARMESLDIRKDASTILIMTKFFSDRAKEGKITSEDCKIVLDSESKDLPTEMKTAYAESLSKEVLYGGETEAGKAQRLRLMEEAVSMIEKNIEIVTKGCNFKFGV